MRKLTKGEQYNLTQLKFKGWSTPVGFKPALEGYHYMDYFDGPFVHASRFLGPDTFGVEPLFESVKAYE